MNKLFQIVGADPEIGISKDDKKKHAIYWFWRGISQSRDLSKPEMLTITANVFDVKAGHMRNVVGELFGGWGDEGAT